ncbi:2-dehydropantoate 2-reductase [Backusella circina FSU 941]|nr:2-dehydropantoate 2-reductase [Backusella circina FSU 941]
MDMYILSTFFHLVGSGALGGIYSWRLSKTCHITTVCRSNYDIVKNEGFDIDCRKFGKEKFRPNNVVRTVTECANESFDYVMVTLKALPEVYNVADIIQPAISPHTTIVLIQNGLGVEESIVERFPDNPLVSFVAYIGASQFAPGKIKTIGGEHLVTGQYKGSKVDSRMQTAALVDLLRTADVSVDIVEDVEYVRWKKIFWNLPFNCLCSITGMGVQDLLNTENGIPTIRLLLGDVLKTAISCGYDFDAEGEINHTINRTLGHINYKPSMLLDMERGNPMEISHILGVPLKRAKAMGLDVPHLESVFNIANMINARLINSKA